MQDVHVDLIVKYNPEWINIIIALIKLSKKMEVSVCDFILKTLNFGLLFGGFIVPLENFSLICRRHFYRWRAAKFDLFPALMAIEQWGFIRVPHLLWHGSSVYNGHLRGPVTVTSIAKRLAVEVSLPVFTNKGCRRWNSKSQPSVCGANAQIHCATDTISVHV